MRLHAGARRGSLTLVNLLTPEAPQNVSFLARRSESDLLAPEVHTKINNESTR